MNIDLTGQVALVTGASRGIGCAIAEQLARSGACVIGTSTSEAGANAITERLSAIQADSYGAALDVNDADAVTALLAHIKTHVGAVSILVNNAGVTQDNLMLRMSEEQWSSVIQTNLTSVFRLSKACLKDMMKARTGRIINVASVVALSGNAGQCNYAASKSGVLGFTKSLAQEVGSRGITVNAIAPGYIQTDMTDALNEAQTQAVMDKIPLNRLGQPEDIARAVCFLSSEAGAYITGETLNISGGLYMR